MNLIMGVSIVLLTNAELMFTGIDSAGGIWDIDTHMNANEMCYL